MAKLSGILEVETIVWHRVDRDGYPDADIKMLVKCADGEVYQGFYEGTSGWGDNTWRLEGLSDDGPEAVFDVVAWAEWPGGPGSPLTKEGGEEEPGEDDSAGVGLERLTAALDAINCTDPVAQTIDMRSELEEAIEAAKLGVLRAMRCCAAYSAEVSEDVETPRAGYSAEVSREAIGCPNDVEVLLHYHCSREPHPRIHAPAVKGAADRLVELGALEPCSFEDDRSFRTTDLGAAWVEAICSTPMPRRR